MIQSKMENLKNNMPITNTKESGFEDLIENELLALHGYKARTTSQFDKKLVMDTELVVAFVQASQPEAWEKLSEQYGAEVQERFLARLDTEIAERGLIDVLRKGVRDRGVTVRLAFWQPQNDLNPELVTEYKHNILSVMRQVKYSEKNENSIDMVLFLNGLPIFTLELKNQLTGQTVRHAMAQYRNDRDPKEKLLSSQRCLTHFAVDTEEVFMTTVLAGLKTRFLPFNKGDKGGIGNPTVKGKYKTHYLWEEVYAKDSVMDLLANFISVQTEEYEDLRGRKQKRTFLIFPRHHQYDTVRRLVSDARTGGSGKNYLIQHSAGSGKSNTIAWTAHRLAELHTEANKNVFDSVIVVTDRRVLDRQLSETVASFAQVAGVVKHVESGSDLREALESGTKIIASTLQKFPVIVAAIDQTAGKKFAVIVDEAHSSQSGESAADLRQVLTLDEATEESVKSERAFKTTEDMLIERMRARKVQSPNVSFFAFTATPKQKTLELFGTEDPLSRKFFPFSLYSMRQAIDEGFILDVLKNYTTYDTYFALLKTIEEDPEFDKKKAERLLVQYVERHDHAIEAKTKIMIEHFEVKISKELQGKAKAMIVTKSRLHAVRYKLAFDKYLAEKGYAHKAMVAFSGVVVDGGKEFTESGMNGVSESQTVETFKEDGFKFMIVAEKLQTGFDQPLLTAMYVDKKLSGVGAVQTLSRLNRSAYTKDQVFVLDFVNTVDEIKDAFQPYYTTTVLSEATNPNIIHDLERDVFGFKLFSDLEMSGLVEELYAGATPDKINYILDVVVERAKEEKNEEELEEFKSTAMEYVRKYGFISQIVTFEDPQLERLFIFLKLLVKKLPKRTDTLPYEVLEAADMDSYKVVETGTSAIGLENEEGVIDPMGGGAVMTTTAGEADALSKIIQDINDRFGTQFSEADRVILNSISMKMLEDPILNGSIMNNSKDSAKIKFNELFQSELVDVLNTHFDLYKKLDQSPELRQYVNERIFEFIVRKKEAITTPKS